MIRGVRGINIGGKFKNMKDLSQEEIGRWIDAAPQLVQDSISSSQTEQLLQGIGKQYSLHIDALGLLGKLITYSLVGYIGPDVFFKELVASGISESDARRMMEEVNQKIFLPIRKQEEELSKNVAAPSQQQPKPVVPTEPVRPVAPSSPHIAQLPPKMTLPTKASPLGETLRSIMAPKPLDTAKLLEDHEEPHIEFKPTPAPTHAVPVAPKETVPALVVPPAPPVPPFVPQPSAPKIEPPAPQKAPPLPPITSYGSDPYREPIDEK